MNGTSKTPEHPEDRRSPGGQGRDLKAGDLQQDGQRNNSTCTRSAVQAPRPLELGSKRAAVLRIFLDRGAAGMNCFEAVRLAHDYVLRTTVSQLKRYHGVAFHKVYEQRPGHAGSVVDVVRYRLTPEGAAMARFLLGLS